MENPPTIHLIANAHLDPVWLWDRHEGLSEGIATVRSVLDLMDRFPELTFIRGEASVYEHLRHWDPDSLDRIRQFIEAGRWDVVGGNWVQPDTNLPGTGALLRQYAIGQEWFHSHLGIRPTCAWAADSFGHGAGFPEIYTSAGFDSFVFSRPLEEQLPLESPLFWWEGPAGSRVLTYRLEGQWYGMERDEIPRRLDAAAARLAASPLGMDVVFFGLGNHGGGPTARHLKDIRRWQEANPDITLVFSGLHRLMRDFRRAADARGWQPPIHRGELNFCLRGCYASSMATKTAYRRAEAATRRAEAARTLVRIAGLKPESAAPDWRALCFNAFHDILPGTSIEEATRQQLEAMARLSDEARDAEHASLLAIARNWRHPDFPAQLPPDHPLPQPVLLHNPHPWIFEGVINLEAPLDYRPQVAMPDSYDSLPLRILNAEGKDLPFQRLIPRNRFLPQFPWRMHTAVRVRIPANGATVVYSGWWPDAPDPVPTENPVSGEENRISGNGLSVEALPGTDYLKVTSNGVNLFGGDGGLRVRAMADSFGSWGGHYDEVGSNDLRDCLETWTVADARVLEAGPLQARLWVRLNNRSGSSRLDLYCILRSGNPFLEFEGRLLWTEHSQRLKLEMPAGGQALYEVPGGTVNRSALGEVPGGRYVRVEQKRGTGSFGFVTDSLTNYNLGEGAFQATLVRTTDFARDKAYDAESEPWRPLHDQGQLCFRFGLTPDPHNLHRQSALLENPVGCHVIPRMGGEALPFTEGLAVEPISVEAVLERPHDSPEGAIQVHLLNHGPDCQPVIRCNGRETRLEPMPENAIRTVTFIP